MSDQQKVSDQVRRIAAEVFRIPPDRIRKKTCRRFGYEKTTDFATRLRDHFGIQVTVLSIKDLTIEEIAEQITGILREKEPQATSYQRTR